MKMPSNKKSAFTLIEMLVVLAIMAIILSITLPAFGPILRTIKLKSSAENLASTLEAARQYAITSAQNCYTAFLTAGTMQYRSYRMYDAGWNSIDKWEFLPNGIVFDNNSKFFTQASTYSVTFPDTSGSSLTVQYIKFSSNGKTDILATMNILERASGMYSSVVVPDYSAGIKVLGVHKKP